MQPQRFFAVVTDAGRLLLMGPKGRTLRVKLHSTQECIRIEGLFQGE